MRRSGPNYPRVLPNDGAAGATGRAVMEEGLPPAGVYLAVSAAGHLVWEFAQMPFYTVWATASAREIVFDAVHCTVGDILIAASALALALFVLRPCNARLDRLRGLAALTILFGLGYTTISEWLNVQVWRTWTYSGLMPVVPPLGTGVLPLLQWLAVPLAALFAARAVTRDAKQTT
jgi:hypothetical protein